MDTDKNNKSMYKNKNSNERDALRRATLLKHRKVSTQLKLDMVQRQLTELKRCNTDPENHLFYRMQVNQLSTELQDLNKTLGKAERSAFYTKHRMLRQNGIDLDGGSGGPSFYRSTENLSRNTSSLKTKVHHLVSSPSGKFKKRQHLFGELRAVASLSSLNTKSSSQPPTEDFKLWKSPLRLFENLKDSKIGQKIWGSSKRAKSFDNIVDSGNRQKENSNNESLSKSTDTFDGNSSLDEISLYGSDIDEEIDRSGWKKNKYKSHVLRRTSGCQKTQVSPAVMAEIEDFEKMVAKYVSQHS